jgi:hypothetical protein
MLKADQIELAILNAVIDWSEPSGRWMDIHQLANEIASATGDVTPAEVIEALLTLRSSNLIELVDSDCRSYEQKDHERFFYGPPFRLKALVGSRRRKQELSRDNRSGVFISHIGDERSVALRLKALLESAILPQPPVFVSSDYESIPSGAHWWNGILEGIRRSEFVIVLLSPASVDRRWINFEAGVGKGQDSHVIPVVWRKLAKSDIGMPLGELHARELESEDEVKALLQTVGSACHAQVNEGPIRQFLVDLPLLENKVPQCELDVRIFRDGEALSMAIRNSGNRPLDMIDAELSIPVQLSRNTTFQAWEPLREVHNFEEDGISFRGFRLTTHPFPRPHLGIEPLRQVLVPEMQDVELNGVGIHLPRHLSQEEELLPVRYRVSARQATIGPIKVPIREVPLRSQGTKPSH